MLAYVQQGRRCTVSGCERPHLARGFCGMHYLRWSARGDPGPPRRINNPAKGLTCAVDECHWPVKAKGYCGTHYWRWRTNGDPGPAARRSTVPTGISCAVEGCRGTSIGNGLCRMHYERMRRRGGLRGPTPEKARAGEGHLSASGDRVITVDGRTVLEHRYVMETALGRPLFRDESVHHRDGDRAHNELSNLELWSSGQPAGQRVRDKIEWARRLMERYNDLPPELR